MLRILPIALNVIDFAGLFSGMPLRRQDRSRFAWKLPFSLSESTLQDPPKQ